MEQKPISRARIKQLLKENPRVKTVPKSAIDWVIMVAERAAKSLAAQGGLTPSGQLRTPRMDPGLMARHTQGTMIGDEIMLVDAPAFGALDASGGEWAEYNDWQAEVKQGKTMLPFAEWKEQR